MVFDQWYLVMYLGVKRVLDVIHVDVKTVDEIGNLSLVLAVLGAFGNYNIYVA